MTNLLFACQGHGGCMTSIVAEKDGSLGKSENAVSLILTGIGDPNCRGRKHFRSGYQGRWLTGSVDYPSVADSLGKHRTLGSCLM